MSTKNRTLVIDLTALPHDKRTDVASTLIGAAQANNMPFNWGEGALMLAPNMGLASHRSLSEALTTIMPVVHWR